jgi:hypothetical protein
MQPGRALACLLTLGAVVGVWCWSLSKKNTPAGIVPASRQTVAVEPQSNAEPETLKAAEVIREGLPAKESRLKELEKENAGLRKDLARLQGADVPASPAEAAAPGKEGTPGVSNPPAGSIDSTQVTSLEQAAVVQKKGVDLENKILEMEGDNMRLRKQVGDEMEAKKPPPTVDEVAARIAATRELAFQRTPVWTPASVEEIISRLSAKAAAGVKPDATEVRVRAYLAMGFVTEHFDYAGAIANVGVMKPGGYYDVETGKFYYQSDASLARADSRSALAGALLPVLIAQNFPAAVPQPLESDNDDASRARQCMAFGDASFARVRFSVSDQLTYNSDRGQGPFGPPPNPVAPQFIADLWKWSEDAGSSFVQTLHQKGGLAEVNKSWQRPPRSTAEVLHPDKLYLAEKPFTPVSVTFPDMTVNGAAPYFTNVAGEIAAYFVLRTYADVDYCTAATEGWTGDRYAVWTGSKEQGDHLLWRTMWATPADAKEFFDALRRIAMQRFEIPWQKEYDAVPDQFRVDDPHRIIHIVRKDNTVTLINATDPGFARGMDAKFAP